MGCLMGVGEVSRDLFHSGGNGYSEVVPEKGVC